MAGILDKPIWSADGLTLSNVLLPVTNLYATYNVTTEWYDGTPMDDSKLDADLVYVKFENKYLLRNMEYGQVLQKDTMPDMRALSTQEVLLLRLGVYKHVQLNGYYVKEDTPTPINYILSNTTATDDGGSVVEIGAIKLEHDFCGKVDVRYFGVKGDNIQDDTAALQRSSNYCTRVVAKKPILTIPPYLGVKTTDTITVLSGISINMESPILYAGATNKTALIIGSSAVNNTGYSFKINISALGNQGDWANNNYVGVDFINAYHCKIDLTNVLYFTKNAIFSGRGGRGNAYNNVYVGEIAHGKEQLCLESFDGGWCNENNFFGGRLWVATTVGKSGQSRYGVVVRSNDGYRQNDNRFWGTSIELNDADAKVGNPNGEAVPIVIENGRQNVFESIRDEGNTITIRTLNDSVSNYVSASFSAVFARYNNRVQDNGDFPSTVFKTLTQSPHQDLGWEVFSCDNIRDYVQYYSESGALVTSNKSVILQNSASLNPTSNVAEVVVNPSSITINSQTVGVGVRVDTNVRKRFNIAVSAEGNAIGRVYIVCRDAGGTVISTDGLVKTSNRYSIIPSTRFGGSFAINVGTNASRDIGNIMQYISVANEVKQISILIMYYLEPAIIKGFKVYSLDGDTTTVPYRNIGLNVATSQPISGTFSGDFIPSALTNTLGYKFDSSGWHTVPLLNQSVAVANVSSPDAIDVASAIVLVNELKAKLNAKLSADRASNQQSNI